MSKLGFLGHFCLGVVPAVPGESGSVWWSGTIRGNHFPAFPPWFGPKSGVRCHFLVKPQEMILEDHKTDVPDVTTRNWSWAFKNCVKRYFLISSEHWCVYPANPGLWSWVYRVNRQFSAFWLYQLNIDVVSCQSRTLHFSLHSKTASYQPFGIESDTVFY